MDTRKGSNRLYGVLIGPQDNYEKKDANEQDKKPDKGFRENQRPIPEIDCPWVDPESTGNPQKRTLTEDLMDELENPYLPPSGEGIHWRISDR